MIGLLMIAVFVVGFWFGSLSDSATLRSWFPPLPTPKPAATPLLDPPLYPYDPWQR